MDVVKLLEFEVCFRSPTYYMPETDPKLRALGISAWGTHDICRAFIVAPDFDKAIEKAKELLKELPEGWRIWEIKEQGETYRVKPVIYAEWDKVLSPPIGGA